MSSRRSRGVRFVKSRRAKSRLLGGLDGWAWDAVKALSLPWFSGLAILLGMVEVYWSLASRVVGCLHCHDSEG